MDAAKFRRFVLLAQLGAWMILFMQKLMFEIEWEEPYVAVLFALTGTLYLMPIVYIHYFFLLPMWRQGRRVGYLFATIGLIVGGFLLYHYVDSFLPTDYPSEEELTLASSMHYFLFIVIALAFSSLFYFVEAWFKNTERENQLIQEKLQSEVNFLKSQINPHFLFNTLNNIYSYAHSGHPKTADMIEKLSSILRFMVYEGGKEMVMLSKEVDAIQNLLDIHKMKNSSQMNIILSTQGIKGYHLIVPLILVNLVENACKHGDVLSNPDGFLIVRISVEEQGNCKMLISNTFRQKPQNGNGIGGIGIKNIQQRLSLQYGNKGKLTQNISSNQYDLELQLPLERKK